MWHAIPPGPITICGSFKINIITGRWADFATQDRGGDLVSLGAYLARCSQSEAALGVANMISCELPADESDLRQAHVRLPHARRSGCSTARFSRNGDLGGKGRGSWRALREVPADAPEPDFFHLAFDEPSRTWAYRSSTGALLGYVVRFDAPGERKQVLPHTYCENENGEHGWQWKGFSSPTPIYGLDQLTARPDAPVLIVEGEKAADAAASRFPSHIATTSQGGSGSPRKANWQSLAGRAVLIWPDNDEAGQEYARDVAELAWAAGATSVSIVDLAG